MAIWFQIALALNVIYWAVFFYLLSRRRWNAPALAVGIFHMLFAAVISVAPIRSLLDPDYIGYGLGVIHFEKRAVAPVELAKRMQRFDAACALGPTRGGSSREGDDSHFSLSEGIQPQRLQFG